MRIYTHENYQEYLDAQIEKNLKKIKHVWVNGNEIKQIAKTVEKYRPDAKLGVCHGVRNGWEVTQLRKLLKIIVIGTDISPTANTFDNVIQMDFHNINKKWLNKLDFIYSNSFDHSYKPAECLNIWMKHIIKHQGICMIHWMKTNENKIDKADCFAASQNEYRNLINDKFQIVEEIGNQDRKIFVIQHKVNTNG